MTKFEEMNNMNTNFVALSDQELMEMEGGVVFFVVGGVAVTGKILAWSAAAVAGAAAVGTAAGYYANRP